ncbi:hypothetical protein C2E23DRAFT_824035 [Lenzites betulinus]|nr:hypothetical protein C2E23DRAFT_824035 [Lenzites betulinus]
MPLLGATVEASREKRIERQQARFRDRGGIFKPSERNSLLDILLARGVNGEAPPRANSPRRSRSRSASPVRKGRKPAKSRKSEGSRAAGRDLGVIVVDGDEEEEPLAGPSKPSKRTKVTKERPTKPRARKSRASTHIPDADEPQPPDTLHPAQPAPSKRKATTKVTKPKKATTSNSTTKAKRPVKRKAPSPDPDPAPSPIPDPSQVAHEPSDDEPLAPRKKARTQRVLESTDKAHPQTQTVEEDENIAKQHVEHKAVKQGRRITAKPKATRPSSTNKSDSSVTDALQEKTLGKGKRKAKASEADDQDEAPAPTNRPKKAPARPRLTVIAESDEEIDAGPGKQRAKRRTADTTPEPGPPALPPKRPAAQEEDAEAPPPARRKGQPVVDAPSSPNLPLAKTSRSAKQAVEEPAPVRKHSMANQELENDPPPSRHRKRRLPEDEAAPSRRPRTQQATYIPPEDEHVRKVSRTKAPPVFAPKGTVLKPKPKPRMSMFPAPPADDESDADPINFLS